MKNIITISCLLFLLKTAINLSAQECLNFAIGLGGSSYYNQGDKPFIDQNKFSSEFWGVVGSSWKTDDAINEIPVDENGYPNAGIPYTTSLGAAKVRKNLTADGRIPQKKYVFLYDGNGTLKINGGSVISNTQGRIEIDWTTDGNGWLTIESSDPAPNHLRNFRMIPLDLENTYSEEQPFYDAFLTAIEPFSALRFMDWFHTNNNVIENWDDRTTKSYHCQTEYSGVAYEYAIQLCNQTQKNAWACVPYHVNDNYIRQMARLFRDSLDANLKVYLEYSNENWNWQFDQAQWINNKYASQGDPNPYYDNNLSHAKNIAKIIKRVFTIWEEEFEGQMHRLVRVVGTQTMWPENYTKGQCDYLGDQWDALAITWYFGMYTGNNADKSNPLHEDNFDATTTPEDVVASARLNFHSKQDNYKYNFDYAKSKGKSIISYEGGQHIVPACRCEPNYQQAVWDAQIHPDIYDLYVEVLDSLSSWKIDLVTPFVLSGSRLSKYGSWGHLEYVEQDPAEAPKYQAILDVMNRCDFTNTLPTASINIISISDNAPYKVFVDGLNSFDTDPTDNIANYYWTCDNAESISGSEGYAQLNFSTTGTYTISLIVEDRWGGLSLAATKEIIIKGGDEEPITNPTGIETSTNHIWLYPNPSQNGQAINISPENSETGLLHIYSLSGTLISTMETKGITNVSLNLSPGIYMIHYTSETKNLQQKLVIK